MQLILAGCNINEHLSSKNNGRFWSIWTGVWADMSMDVPLRAASSKQRAPQPGDLLSPYEQPVTCTVFRSDIMFGTLLILGGGLLGFGVCWMTFVIPLQAPNVIVEHNIHTTASSPAFTLFSYPRDSCCECPPPMPPDAPVTSADFPVSSNILAIPSTVKPSDILQQRFDVVRRLNRAAGHLPVDPPGQARQHVAGTEFDQRIDALFLHVQHALPPAHHTGDLLN